MKKIFLGAVLALVLVFLYKSCAEAQERKTRLQENSALLQQELKKVAKLIVTEGHFVEVYTYADAKEVFGTLLTATKKALVVVNAEVTVSYDLAKITYEIDEANKTLTLTQIPEPEIKINPDFEYYDVTADYFNPFNAADYNAIKRKAIDALQQKVAASSLRSNAENRLVSELSRVYVLTHALGWRLVASDKMAKEVDGLYFDETPGLP